MKNISTLNIPFAKDMNNNVVELSLNLLDNTHCHVSGGVGSGKTNLLRVIAKNAMDKYSENLDVWYYGLAINEMTDLQIKYQANFKIYEESNAETIKAFVKDLSDEVQKRCNLFNRLGVPSYLHFKNDLSVTRMLILIDDFYSIDCLLKNDLIMQSMFEKIIVMARAFGISFVITEQVGLQKSEFTSGLTVRAKNAMSSIITFEKSPEKICKALSIRPKELRLILPKIFDEISINNFNVNMGECIYKKGVIGTSLCIKKCVVDYCKYEL